MAHDCDKCSNAGQCNNEETFRMLRELSQNGVKALIDWLMDKAKTTSDAELFNFYDMACDVTCSMERTSLKEFVDGVTVGLTAHGRQTEDASMRHSYYEGEVSRLMAMVQQTQQHLSDSMGVEDLRLKLAKALASGVRGTKEDKKHSLH